MLAFGDKASPPMLEIRTAPTRVIFDELHAGSLDLGITVEVESERVPSGLASERLFDSVMDLIAPRPSRACAERSWRSKRWPTGR